MGSLGDGKRAGVDVKSWPVRLGVLAVLMITYMFIWRPVRSTVTLRLIQPVLAPTAQVERGVSFDVETGNTTAIYRTVAGTFWLFPSMVFVLMGHWKPVLKLWAAHLIAGVIIFACFWIGVYGAADWMTKIGEFIITYLVPAGSIGYIVVYLTKSTRET